MDLLLRLFFDLVMFRKALEIKQMKARVLWVVQNGRFITL